MAKLRRAHLMAVTVVTLNSLLGCQMRMASADASAGIHIMNGNKPGSFRIVNDGNEAAELDREVIVETKTKDQWKVVKVELKLTASCGTATPRECLKLVPGQSIEPVAWSGLGCGAQCALACRADVYYGPGEFRLSSAIVPRVGHGLGNDLGSLHRVRLANNNVAETALTQPFAWNVIKVCFSEHAQFTSAYLRNVWGCSL